MVFNALKYVEVLKKAGVPDKQAEAQVRVLNEIMESDLATKRDIESLRHDTKKDIADVRKDIEVLKQSTKRDLKELEQRMLIKLGGLLVIALTAMAAFLK